MQGKSRSSEGGPVSEEKPVTTILELLEAANVRQRYESVFIREKLTLENFVKLVQMDQAGLTSTFLKRCKMSCGDFAELVVAYEKSVLQGRPLQKSNQIQEAIDQARLKIQEQPQARSTAEATQAPASDPYKTPTQEGKRLGGKSIPQQTTVATEQPVEAHEQKRVYDFRAKDDCSQQQSNLQMQQKRAELKNSSTQTDAIATKEQKVEPHADAHEDVRGFEFAPTSMRLNHQRVTAAPPQVQLQTPQGRIAAYPAANLSSRQSEFSDMYSQAQNSANTVNQFFQSTSSAFHSGQKRLPSSRASMYRVPSQQEKLLSGCTGTSRKRMAKLLGKQDQQSQRQTNRQSEVSAASISQQSLFGQQGPMLRPVQSNTIIQVQRQFKPNGFELGYQHNLNIVGI